MLECPPNRAPAASRSARHRQRLKSGRACYVIEAGAEVLDMLVRLGWIEERELVDKKVVAAALATMLLTSAENLGAAHGRCPNCGHEW
jgi:hypothetical protein